MTDTETPAPPEPAALPWADVHVEHFQLLRLAPLPTSHDGTRPLRFVEVGHAERHDLAFSLLRQEVRLPGQRVHKTQNRLDVWVDHQSKSIRLGADLDLQPLDRGLGRFLLAQAVTWLQRRWSHYRVESRVLPPRDALRPETKLRRDHVLERLGIPLVDADGQTPDHTAELEVAQLKGGFNTERVQRVDTLEAAGLLQQADADLQAQEASLRERDERVARYQREDGSLRFTIACLVAFAVFQAALLIWMASR